MAVFEEKEEVKINVFLESLEISRINNAKKGIMYYLSQALIGLGNMRYEDNNRNRIDRYLEAKIIAEANGYKELKCQVLIGLGNANTGNRKTQIDCYLEAEKIAQEIHNFGLHIRALEGRANALKAKRKNEEAWKLYIQILRDFKISDHKKDEINENIESLKGFIERSRGKGKGVKNRKLDRKTSKLK